MMDITREFNSGTEFFNINMLLQETWNKYGTLAQILKTIEELAELQRALVRFINFSQLQNVIEEIADVEIMLFQIKYGLNINELDISDMKLKKIERLQNMDNE